MQRLAEGVERQRLHVVLEVGRARLGSLRVKAPSCDGAMLIGPAAHHEVLQADPRLAPQRAGQRVQRPRPAPCRPRGSAGGPAGSRRRRQVVRPRCHAARSSAPGPMPESCRSCGVPIAPAASTTSRAARPRARLAARPTSTPRTPARRRARAAAGSTCAPVQTCRLRAPRRPQEGLGRVPAHAAALVDLEVADAFVVAAVEVVGWDAGLGAAAGEGVEDVPAQPLPLDPPFAAAAPCGRSPARRGTLGVQPRQWSSCFWK